MPRKKSATVHYQRGNLQLVQRPGRPSLEITWYDPTAGGNRYSSTGTLSIEEGKLKLDDKYLELTKGVECCPTCRRPYDTGKQFTVLEAIEVHLATSKSKPSYKAIAARLDHIVSFLETQARPDIFCSQVDEAWIARFRAWNEQIPVVSPAGNVRDRALSTVENSVLQLAAAMRCVKEEPQFKTIQVKTLNRTPSYRATIDDLAAMFAYALTPKKRRDNLLAFLRVSVLTMARPDAAHELSIDPRRKQWDAQHGIVHLNPAGRRQTKKVRATVPIVERGQWLFNHKGFLVVGSAKKSMAAMSSELGLPGDGASGLKLIRRSMAHLVRQRLEARDKPLDQLEAWLGHRVVDAVSELYAPFSPSYLQLVKGIVGEIVNEIEALAPGAFSDTAVTEAEKVIPLKRA
ncbi:hypothetical protein [Sphingomonas jaspsi]|uniref:hypothetical protein n=1 Tax=Sphingomonas jaspsi TaxID=392409 RepID=UPI0004B3315F|nr:hypothetical protein [Sphingomonas jaspsi]